MNNRDLEEFCRLNARGRDLLDEAITRFRLSARAYHRILKVARTIADLETSQDINIKHLGEAISYRSFDRLL